MKKGINSFFVSLIALVLAMPFAGVTSSFVSSDSELSSNEILDFSRDSYEVDIDYSGSNDGFQSITRNQLISIEFLVSNTGSSDDTYDLEISWEDDGSGWFGSAEEDTVSVSSFSNVNVNFSFQAPIQYVYDDSQMTYTLEAHSQNSSASDSLEQIIDINMVYAVDIELKQGSSKEAKRGESASYVATITNSGETADYFDIEFGQMPKDWTGSISVSSVYLEPSSYEDIIVEITVPDTAAVDEYALIDVIGRVQEEDYAYIYGYQTTNTTAEDGRTYKVDIVADAQAKQIIPGGMIIYDLLVINEGDETDSFILELGNVSKVGWVSDLSQYEIDNLGPGEDYSLVLSVFSPEDAEENDWSLTEMTVYSANREQFSDISTVNTSVRLPNRDVALSTPEDSLSGNPGSVLTYTISVMNTGTDPDDFNMAIEVCEGCNSWVVSLSKYLIKDLDDGDSEDIQFFVQVPSSARDTDSAIFGIKAVSDDDSEAFAELAITATVNTVFGQSIIITEVPIMYPGDSNQFSISLTNEGNSHEAYKVTEGNNVPSGWSFESTLPFETQNLEPYGGTETFAIPFEIPDAENPGYYNFTMFVKLSSSGLKVMTVEFSVKVEYYADFDIDVIPSQSIGDPGFTHSLPVTITNNANADEEIDFTVESLPSGWTYCVLFNGNCLNSLNVAKGVTSDFTLEVTTLQNEPANSVNGIFLKLVGVSSLNNKFSTFDSFTILTNPTYILSSTTPSNSKVGESGDTIPFQLIITNLGNDIDYVNLPSPELPSGWTGTYTESSFTLEPSDSKTIYLNVQIPENVFGGNNTITSKVSSHQSGQVETLVFTVYIDEKADIDIELVTTAGTVTAGTSGTFKVSLTNNGNTKETLSLKMEGKRLSWFTIFDAQGNAIDSLIMVPGDQVQVSIEVRPPLTQAASDTSGTFNVTLSSDTSKSIKLSLPLEVLKSDLIDDTVVEEEEDSLLSSLGVISVLFIVSLISIIRRKNF